MLVLGTFESLTLRPMGATSPTGFFAVLFQISSSHKLFSSKAVYLFFRHILVTFSYSRVLWLRDDEVNRGRRSSHYKRQSIIVEKTL